MSGNRRRYVGSGRDPASADTARRRGLWSGGPAPDRRAVREALAAVAVWSAALLVSAVLAWILWDMVSRGVSQWSVAFLIAAPGNAGRTGGIGPVIVATLWILMVTMLIAVPLSLGTAVALVERTREAPRLARLVRRSLDVLAAVPSIVFGLFGNAFFCIALGMGYSILSGGLTLACMVLPILTRVAEQALRAVPEEYRHGGAALGLSRTTMLLRITLPAAAPALAAGLVLGIGRALAETAALIFTAGYVMRMPASWMDSGRALSVHIYDMAMNVPGGDERAYATAAVLVVILLAVNRAAGSLMRIATQDASRDAGGGTP